MSSHLYTTRDYLESDKNFIFASWLRGLYYGNGYFREMPKDLFMSNYHDFLEKVLAMDGIRIKVACLKEDPEVILGYAVLNQENTVLNWVFVKSAWRGIGVGRSLTPSTLQSVSHLTKTGTSILRTLPGVVFNPFKLT